MHPKTTPPNGISISLEGPFIKSKDFIIVSFKMKAQALAWPSSMTLLASLKCEYGRHVIRRGKSLLTG